MIGGAFLILAVSAILIVCLWADKYDDYPDTATRPPPLALKDAAEPQTRRRGLQKTQRGLQKAQRGLQKAQRGLQNRSSKTPEPHPSRAAPSLSSSTPKRRLKYWEIEDMEAEAAELRAPSRPPSMVPSQPAPFPRPSALPAPGR